MKILLLIPLVMLSACAQKENPANPDAKAQFARIIETSRLEKFIGRYQITGKDPTTMLDTTTGTYYSLIGREWVLTAQGVQ